MSKPNLLVTNVCALNRQVFGLYRLNKQRFLTHEPIYLSYFLYTVPSNLNFTFFFDQLEIFDRVIKENIFQYL